MRTIFIICTEIVVFVFVSKLFIGTIMEFHDMIGRDLWNDLKSELHRLKFNVKYRRGGIKLLSDKEYHSKINDVTKTIVI